MESQIINDSVPISDSDSDIISSTSLLAPVIDLRVYIIENYLDIFEIVEDTPERGLPSQSLSGTLSPGIGNLTNLQSVLLQNNAISGVIPSAIGKLEKLQALDLSNNKLGGNIPTSLLLCLLLIRTFAYMQCKLVRQLNSLTSNVRSQD
ncbi:hypothetical protein POM88_035582 [Heracleum sosnowskyi]|uniref:Uncharacterized protein n=1 Tax=Heracleum sosnowskyi TaxID=360622 RepID=A0AAD8HNS3_9APIA|nr:hypothetical protein POM88_035582 [Heracleum sosnowskyi]